MRIETNDDFTACSSDSDVHRAWDDTLGIVEYAEELGIFSFVLGKNFASAVVAGSVNDNDFHPSPGRLAGEHRVHDGADVMSLVATGNYNGNPRRAQSLKASFRFDAHRCAPGSPEHSRPLRWNASRHRCRDSSES